MNNRIAILIPFFGDLNIKGYFQRFLDSCKVNSQVTWFIFSDDHTQYEYPENVKITYISFEKIRELIQSKFDFEIALPSPYKLCDFKPAYGDIFEEYIEGYDWWGYGDTDLIWGRIDHFITDDLLNQYEQLYSRGHLTLSINNRKMRSLYKDSGGVELYKSIFTDKKHYAFDELHTIGGYREIIGRRGITLYDELDFADISKVNKHGAFTYELAQVQLKQYEKSIGCSVFLWSKDGLERIYFKEGKLQKNEYLYAHFQRRVIIDKACSRDNFCVVPNMILDDPKIITSPRIILMHCNSPNMKYGMSMISTKIKNAICRIANRLRH